MEKRVRNFFLKLVWKYLPGSRTVVDTEVQRYITYLKENYDTLEQIRIIKKLSTELSNQNESEMLNLTERLELLKEQNQKLNVKDS